MGDVSSIVEGDLLMDKLWVTLDLEYDNGDSKLININPFTTIPDNISFSLFKEGTTDDVIDLPVEAKTSYVLEATIDDVVTSQIEFETDNGVHRLWNKDITIRNRDIDKSYAPATGDVKILIIPVKLTGSWTDEWTEEDLAMQSCSQATCCPPT